MCFIVLVSSNKYQHANNFFKYPSILPLECSIEIRTKICFGQGINLNKGIVRVSGGMIYGV